MRGTRVGIALRSLKDPRALFRLRGYSTYGVLERQTGFEDKRYGLLASSKAKNLERFGIDNSFQATRRVKKGPWFVDDPCEPLSCCRLDSVATEFACQGPELDLPIVAWGDDLV
jgi:hypothetical protein